MCTAYEILSDPDKRSLYDQFGEEGLQGGGDSPFPSWGDFWPGQTRRRGEKKAEDVAQGLEVTLEDLYNGNTFHIPVERNVLCDLCQGYCARRPPAHMFFVVV